MIITILFGIVGFGIMVFVHELGHFIAAKRVGIEVEAFSVGWGKKLVSIDYKGTNYRLSIIPFGGYCKMKGEIPTDENERFETGSFFAATPWRRILTAAAGPLSNLIFAFLVLTFIWWIGFNIYSDGNRIVLAADYSLDTVDDQSPAAMAGLKSGDRIIGIDGQRIEKFQDILETVSTRPNETLSFTVEREQRQIEISVVPELDLETGAGRIGVYAWRDLLIDEVREGSAAEISGIQPGDRITAVGGQEVQHSIDLYQHLQGKPGILKIGVLREGQYLERDLVLSYNEEGMADLGLEFQVSVFRSQAALNRAVVEGFKETGRTMVLTVKGIGLLFQGVNVRNAVAGPLRISYYVGSVARSGFRLGFAAGMVSYFRFLCLLSIILFIMNLLPIPALDGGQILIFLIETIRRKRLNPRLIARIQTIGFSVLILLAVVITFSDVLFFVGR